MKLLRSALLLSLVTVLSTGCSSNESAPVAVELPAEEQSELRVRIYEHPASDIDETFVVVEEMPVLLGGLSTLQAGISYPTAGCPTSLQGRVFLQFVVDKEGEVRDPSIARSLSEGCDAEALRAVRNLTFEPGLQRGQRVNVRMSLPVTFKTD